MQQAPLLRLGVDDLAPARLDVDRELPFQEQQDVLQAGPEAVTADGEGISEIRGSFPPVDFL
ncbi:hypothetical protein CWE27_17435 [Streptomyces sp. EAG2]|nr:hypothetical protein CWE27_17435 [Streptomyces sp. EAG2]